LGETISILRCLGNWNTIVEKKKYKLKLATINIDWFKKSKELKNKILNEIRKQELDFLIVNENIENFSFDKSYFVYNSKSIPTNKIFQHLDYGKYLNGFKPIRTSIYSKYESIQELKTLDSYTSVCHKFQVQEKIICIYATIIGTWGIKFQEEIARNELDNFKADSQNLLSVNENFFICGDFNTSFIENEKRQLAKINSRAEIVEITDRLKICRATEMIEHCIDHIFISSNLNMIGSNEITTFLDDDILKDSPHKGICLKFNFQ